MNTTETFQHKSYSFYPDIYNNQNIIWVEFPAGNIELLEHLKIHAGNHLKKVDSNWYVPNNGLFRTLFRFNEHELKRIPEINRDAYEYFVDELYNKGYKIRTIKTYSNEFNHFLRVFDKIHVSELTPEQIRSYLYYCTAVKKQSTNLIHSRVNSMKFYYEDLLGKKDYFKSVPRPQKLSKYSNPFTLKEVDKMIAKTKNPKHKLLLTVCYGLGLKVSELVQIKYSDIDEENMKIRITEGKNDSNFYYINLTKSILDEINEFKEEYCETEYLFAGNEGKQYSIRSVQKVFSDAMKRVNIKQTIGLYNIHKPYSTQLIERGIDLDFIEEYIK